MLKIGIVGATGAVGEKILEILGERNTPIGELRLFASEKSAGRLVEYKGDKIEVEVLEEKAMREKYDYIFLAAGGKISEIYGPIGAQAGNIVIDNSSHFRMVEGVPLVVPELNSHVLRDYRGIIANPNCSTTQMLVALGPIHRKYGIEKIVVSTYQAVSGSGYEAIEELERQSKDKTYPNKVYPRRIGGNCIPHIDSFMDNGFSKEELKLVYESHKILEDDGIEINPTAVRVPVLYGHSESIYLELKEEVSLEEIRSLLAQSPSIVVEDRPEDNIYPTPLEVAGSDQVYVGRIRKDLYNPKALSLWLVADNLRKGAATNAVQIMEAIENMKMEG